MPAGSREQGGTDEAASCYLRRDRNERDSDHGGRCRGRPPLGKLGRRAPAAGVDRPTKQRRAGPRHRRRRDRGAPSQPAVFRKQDRSGRCRDHRPRRNHGGCRLCGAFDAPCPGRAGGHPEPGARDLARRAADRRARRPHRLRQHRVLRSLSAHRRGAAHGYCGGARRPRVERRFRAAAQPGGVGHASNSGSAAARFTRRRRRVVQHRGQASGISRTSPPARKWRR